MRQLRRRSRRTLKVWNMGARCGWESRVMHWVGGRRMGEHVLRSRRMGKRC